MELRKTELSRRQIKSSEGEFIWELKNSYELSPKLSEQILLTAKESFTKVLMAQSKGIYQSKEISAVTGISEGLVKQYLGLIRESKKDKTRSENPKDLIKRNSYRVGIKKTAKRYSEPQAAMMGGLL